MILIEWLSGVGYVSLGQFYLCSCFLFIYLLILNKGIRVTLGSWCEPSRLCPGSSTHSNTMTFFAKSHQGDLIWPPNFVCSSLWVGRLQDCFVAGRSAFIRGSLHHIPSSWPRLTTVSWCSYLSNELSGPLSWEENNDLSFPTDGAKLMMLKSSVGSLLQSEAFDDLVEPTR